jgi:hypothetical protein
VKRLLSKLAIGLDLEDPRRQLLPDRADMVYCVAITLLKSEKLEQRVAGLN